MSSRISRINRINAGYSAALLLLILCYVFTFIISTKLRDQTKSISDTDSTVARLDKVVSNLKGAQAAWNEYIVTNNRNNFEEYHATHRSIDSLLSVLYQLSSTNPSQKRSLDTLNTLIAYMLPDNKKNTTFYSRNNMIMIDSLRRVNRQYSDVMDSITALITGMQAEENKIVKNKKITLMSLAGAIKIISLATLILALFLGIYMLVNFNKERYKKKRAYKKADDYHAQLEFRIGELTKMNKEIVKLKSLEKFTSLGRIAALIAHEIKNPLTNINLAIMQLTDELPKGEPNTFIDIIKRNSDKINTLITDFLNATAFSELNIKSVSINDFIDEILQECADRIRLEGITVQKDYAANICEVSLDADKIKIAFLNIIFNAIDAMEPGKGILHIKTEGNDEKCTVIISDNGTGMDEETLSKIFEPYFTTKPKYGSGLGLAQTQNIVLNHGGTIEVESEPNKGTRFIITLNYSRK